MTEAEKGTPIAVPIEFSFPESLQSRYSNNFLVQHSDGEFIISFFEVLPPVVLGEPQQVIEQLRQIKSVRADCVARIIVPSEKMPDLIRVLQDNLERHASSDRKEPTNE
jgi:hypothetical protein